MTFYKQCYVEGHDEELDISFNQTLIVSYSLKYKIYQQMVREQQIERAVRYNDGEVAEKVLYNLDTKAIEEEAQYDGFYAVYTNLDDDPADVIRINQGRWEIEESFRIMKSGFEARPVYLQRKDRILPHYSGKWKSFSS